MNADHQGARRPPSPLAWVALAAVRGYRYAVSPLLPAACRFHPSCSAYAAEAIERFGFVRGALLAAFRVARCQPFHPGGLDPVPDVFLL